MADDVFEPRTGNPVPARAFGTSESGISAQVRGKMSRTASAAKRRAMLKLVAEGSSIRAAAKAVGVSQDRWHRWRKADPAFDAEAARALEVRDARLAVAGIVTGTVGAGSGKPDIGFAEFRKKYLYMDTFAHQDNLIALVDGREPPWLHASMTFEKGEPNFVLVNIPPEHAKSMTISIDYPTFQVATRPNSRGMLVSKTQTRAREFLYAVKQRLTHPRYTDLQVAYGPPEGYEKTADAWQADTIYLGGAVRESAEKDPTLQALGIGGQIYGSRADYIIIDDAITLSNAHEYEKQIRWVQQEVLTRLGPNGLLMVVGTRVDSVDFYRELVNPDRYPSGQSPWTVLRMPAVLEFADDPADWVTLWPKSDTAWPGSADQPDADGLFPRWDGAHLKRRRSMLDPKTWSMVYQQQEVAVDSVFPAELVRASVNQMRKTSPLIPGAPGHPDSTTAMTVVAGLDPAIAGDMGVVVMAVDRQTKKRWVLDALKVSNPTPKQIRDTIFAVTDEYKIAEWRMEKNAFQGYLTQDEDLRMQLASRGVIIREHFTGKNKWDVDYGVASLAPLFGTFGADGKPNKDHLIELPSTVSEGAKALVEQLITWSPSTKNKTDMVMALWMAEIRAREIASQWGALGGTHMPNRYLSPYSMQQRVTVNLEDVAAAGQMRLVAGG